MYNYVGQKGFVLSLSQENHCDNSRESIINYKVMIFCIDVKVPTDFREYLPNLTNPFTFRL